MKGFFRILRSVAAAAVLLGLAACGGGSNVNSYEMRGTITGLTTGPLTLTNGISTVNIPTGSTTFVFPNQITLGLNFNVQVLLAPTDYTCAIANGYGTAGLSDTTIIAVTCAPNSSLGGTISGAKGDVVLANGATQVTIAQGATTWAFGTKVSQNISYGVTVLSAPAGQTCTVTNGTGTMGVTAVNNVVVTCI
jgi:hypothetical protein